MFSPECIMTISNLILSNLILTEPTRVNVAKMFVCMSVWNKGVWAIF